MDFSNPYVLVSGLFIGLIGMGLLMYGKKSMEPKCIGIGLAMCVYPYFVTSLVLMWLLAAMCVAGVYYLPRAG